MDGRPAFLSATHAVLFEDEAIRCDACGAEVAPDDDDEGPAVPGRALYVSARGDALHREEAPLCPRCAVAIGMTAIQRWDVEEEEG